MVEKLLAAGVAPDALPQPDEEGMPALMLAAQRGHVRVLEALIAAGADVHQSVHDETPLMCAARPPGIVDPVDQPKAIRTLVAAGASLDPLHEEARSRVMEVMAQGVGA